MDTAHHPYTKSLSHRGFISGSTLVSKTPNQPLCHYFGGLRYALAPEERWRRAVKLPASYTYGSKERPGQHDGHAAVCPQPPFRALADEEGWSEDCYQCNVWVPVGEPPAGGWPVLIYIHGGWLQFGTPNTFSVASLIGSTSFKAVVVMPAYRLNVLGFLYSSELEADAASVNETVGNHGFWDQRLAMEWTKENVHLFGGDPGNITLSGYSAGAYSVFHQLAYDLRLPDSASIIKQACIWSNGPGVQPKYPADAQKQFTQLLEALNIPAALSGPEKLSALRKIPAKRLVDAASSIQIHQFRPATDNSFVAGDLFESLDNGSFAKALVKRNIRVLLGECRDEHFLYGIWRPPEENTVSALRSRLLADYPRPVVDALLPLYTNSNTKHNPNTQGWSAAETFGHIYADMQVHTLQRGLLHSLVTSSPPNPNPDSATNASDLVYRYRIEYRAECVDATFPREWGVTHATDMALWFFGNGSVLSSAEREIVERGVVGPFARFVNGEREINWGTKGIREVRVLRPDGNVRISRDEGAWEEAGRVWDALLRAQRAVAGREQKISRL